MNQPTTTRRFKVNKLVRDQILEHLQSKGICLKYHVASENDYISLLKAKLIEEARGVLNAQTPQEVAEECADVLEVIEALYCAANISYDTVREIRNKKAEEKGCFEKRIFGEYMEIQSDNTKALAYYEARADEYPAIDMPVTNEDR